MGTDIRDFYSKIVNNLEGHEHLHFVEVGVYLGKSIIHLYKELQKKLPEDHFKVTAVDLWELFEGNTGGEGKQGQSFRLFLDALDKEGLNNKIKIIKKASFQAAKHFKPNSIDFVFIDANHEMESVVQDINAWLPKIKQGGILAGHDYKEAQGVKNAVTTLVPNAIIENNIWWVTKC